MTSQVELLARLGRLEARNGLLDAPLHALGHLLERQLLIELLHCLCDGGLDALGSALGGGAEVVDVALPARRPLVGLTLQPLFSAGHGHVEGSEDADAGSADAEDFGGLGLGETGDAGSHGDD